MAVKEILNCLNPILREKSADVEAVGPEIKTIISDMTDTLYNAPGIGLAAPQIGILKNIIVVDISEKEGEESGLKVLVNPEITHREGEIVFEEGCLSLPDFLVKVKRSCDIVVNAMNEEGEKITLSCNGLLSVVIQHEMDHLRGVMIIDYASHLKRTLYLKKLRKKEEKNKPANPRA